MIEVLLQRPVAARQVITDLSGVILEVGLTRLDVSLAHGQAR